MKKDIAVLMPAYNPGHDIIETLNSLKAQTEPFKLFVITNVLKSVGALQRKS